jgi:hypothetical protein
MIAEIFNEGKITITYSEWVNFIITLFIQFFWSQLDDLSFLMVNTLISMYVPNVAQII